MIKIWKAITCDNCGQADYYRGSNKSVNEQAKNLGWLIFDIRGRNGKIHLCDKQCKKEYKSKLKQK